VLPQINHTICNTQGKIIRKEHRRFLVVNYTFLQRKGNNVGSHNCHNNGLAARAQIILWLSKIGRCFAYKDCSEGHPGLFFCRAATDASFSRLAFQPEPAARSACLTSSWSALQVDGHNGGAKRMRLPLPALASDALRAEATFTWGADGEHAPNRGGRNRPVRSPEAGPDIYCRGLG
jgi:hypothetical protein